MIYPRILGLAFISHWSYAYASSGHSPSAILALFSIANLSTRLEGPRTRHQSLPNALPIILLRNLA
jgi:hypothetical protein